MLQAIRENAQGVIIWIIVVFVILGLSSFILSSYLGNNAKSYVAKVNDVEISNRQFSMAFNNRQAQLQQQLGDNFARFFNEKLLRTSVVNGLVDSELLTQLTHEAGFRNSAEQAKQSLEKIDLFQGEDGKFSNQKFSDFVVRYGYTPEGYALEQAVSLSKQQLMNGITDSAFTLKASVVNLERLTKQQRDVGLLLVSLADVSKHIEVSDEEVKSWFDQHASEFMTQEKIKVDYIELSMTDLAKKQDVDEDEVRDYYQKHKTNYTKDDYSAAKKKIDDIAARLKKGESFEKLAKEFSQDPGSAQNGGDLGFFGKGIMDPAFEQAVYSLKKGEVSKPVKTSFGYHLIKLEDIKGDQRRARHILIKKENVSKSYDEVKAIITSTLRLQKAERIFYEDQTKLDNLTYQHQDSLEPAAEALDVPIKTSPYFTRAGGPQMFRNTDLLHEAFSEEVLDDLLNSNVIKLSDDDFVVLRLKEHVAAKQKPFEEVKSVVEDRLRQEKAKQQVAKLSQEYRKQLSNGAKPETIAAEHKEVSWHAYGFIGRETRYDANKPEQGKNAATPSGVSPDVRKTIFSLGKPAADKVVYHDMSAKSGNGVVIVLKAVRDNPVKDDDKTLQAMQKQLTQAEARTDAAAVIEYMRSKSEIDINQDKDEDNL